MVDNAEWLSDIYWVLIIVIGFIFLDYISKIFASFTLIACGIFYVLYEGRWDLLLAIGYFMGWVALAFVVNYILVKLFKCEIELGCLLPLMLFILLPIEVFVKKVLIYWEWWQISVLIGVVLLGLIVLGYFRRRAIARSGKTQVAAQRIDRIQQRNEDMGDKC